jgi:tetratricopeptide (TPR) repeat protein
VLLALALAGALFAWQKPAPAPLADPPEEDTGTFKEKEYTLNPVQAEKEFKIGLYYAKKKSWRAAAGRFDEAAKWNPSLAEAYFKKAEALEKLSETAKARQAWEQFLEAAPDDKRSAEVQKKLKAAPPPK